MGKHSEANGEMEGTRMQTCLVLVFSKLLNANNRVREIEINLKTEEMREKFRKKILYSLLNWKPKCLRNVQARTLLLHFLSCHHYNPQSRLPVKFVPTDAYVLLYAPLVIHFCGKVSEISPLTWETLMCP